MTTMTMNTTAAVSDTITAVMAVEEVEGTVSVIGELFPRRGMVVATAATEDITDVTRAGEHD